jgi:hypothetical protein
MSEGSAMGLVRQTEETARAIAHLQDALRMLDKAPQSRARDIDDAVQHIEEALLRLRHGSPR